MHAVLTQYYNVSLSYSNPKLLIFFPSLVIYHKNYIPAYVILQRVISLTCITDLQLMHMGLAQNYRMAQFYSSALNSTLFLNLLSYSPQNVKAAHLISK